jgi:hypothetical protein
MTRRIPYIISLLFIFPSLLAGNFRLDAAQAKPQVGINGISPIFEVYSDTLNQNTMVLAFNPATASYLVVWSTEQDSYTTDLWARPVFMDGRLGPVFNIDSSPNIGMYYQTLAADPGRLRFLLVYYTRNDSNDITILARTVSWNGGQISSPVTLMSGHYSSSREPSVVYNPNRDEYLVVYDDSSDPGCSYTKMYAVRINAETLALTPPVQIGQCTADEYSYNGQVVLNIPADQYQLAYARYVDTNSTYYLLTRWLLADLSQMGVPVELNSSLSNEDVVHIASGPNGYLAAYFTIESIYFQIYGWFIRLDGSLEGEPFKIPVTMEQATSACSPSIAYLGALGYIATWCSQTAANPSNLTDVFFRLVPDRPLPPNTKELVLANGPDSQYYSLVSCALGRQCLLIFQDDSSGDRDIFARQFFINYQLLPIVRR